MKRIKCKVCGNRFFPHRENMYLAVEKQALGQVLVSAPKVTECFDCPLCGCQNAVNVRNPKQEENK